MAQQQECWLESVWHVVNDDNGIEESDAFMDATGDEFGLRENFQIDPDLLNDGEPGQDDSELALQHQAIEASPEIGDPDYSEAIASDIDIYDDTFDHELEEEDDAESCPEAESHVIIEDALPEESDDFMGTAEDELALLETFQIDPDLLNNGGPIPDGSELVLQSLEMEASSETDDPKISKAVLRDAARHEAALYNFPEADDMESFPESHIIIDDSLLEESDDFMGTAEDERALRGVDRNDAGGTSSKTDASPASEPAKAERFWLGEGMYLNFDQFMVDMRQLVGVWDKKYPPFIRSKFRKFIYMRIRDSLKSSVIEERFGGTFEGGEWGMNRKLLKVDPRLLDAFIDELCIMRLDLTRLDWDEFIDEQTRYCALIAHRNIAFEEGNVGIRPLKEMIPASIKSSQLVEKFRADIEYDREYDELNVWCNPELLDKAIEAFVAKMNRRKPLFLKEKEEIYESERKLCEIKELREKLEAESVARQKAEAEVARLLAEKVELEVRLAEKPAGEPRREAVGETEKGGEQGEPLADPERRAREIRRIRDEWSDCELDGESRIWTLKKELSSVETELSRIEYEHERLSSAYQLELRKWCEEEDCPYWTPAQISRIEGIPWRYEEFKAIREKVWAGYAEKLAPMEERMRLLKKRGEELREDLADQERVLAIEKMEHETRLRTWGASLDPSILCDSSDVDELGRDEGAAAPDFVLPGLPLEKTGCFAGPTGLGKTQITTQLGFSIACGRDGLVKGGVLHIYGEDDRAVMAQRRAATLANLSPKLSESELADIKANFVPWHLDGKRVDLADAQSEGTQVFRRKLKLVERDFRRKGIRLRLIVLDTLSVFNGGRETLSEHVHAMLEALQRICLETGASLVFLHHTTKEAGGSGNSGAGSVRGHSSLANDVRWVTILSAMTEKEARALGVCEEERSRYVKMTLAKCNSAAPQEPQWFMKTDSGVFVPADFGKTGKSESISGITSGSNREKNVSRPAAPSRSGIVEPDTAPVHSAQAMPEKRDAFADSSILQEPETPAITSRQADSSGEHIGSEADKPRSEKPLPVSGTGSGRLNRSFGGLNVFEKTSENPERAT